MCTSGKLQVLSIVTQQTIAISKSKIFKRFFLLLGKSRVSCAYCDLLFINVIKIFTNLFSLMEAHVMSTLYFIDELPKFEMRNSPLFVRMVWRHKRYEQRQKEDRHAAYY